MIILESERLILRHQRLDDLEALFALYADPDLRRYIPDAPTTLEETREELAWHQHGHATRPELGLWATILKADGTYLGRCGLLPWTLDGREEVEVAFLIAKSHWGRGLATEAARAIRDYAFTTLGLQRLICLIDPANRGSIRVAEKIGMTFERAGEDEMGPFLIYAMARN
ncbi:MAG: GNAT family N-acetyltransferase [Anaerolineales bacterium]|nr:GNAT family N-acetyltransferase [Anaerolineales bacterium]MCB9128961.1 GNAT family N-acetyltransferase [Ardenticatenales bacterium]MCB9172806.1 GNAT family N-acetyltransferase [Ardenticatenales bacterium]